MPRPYKDWTQKWTEQFIRCIEWIVEDDVTRIRTLNPKQKDNITIVSLLRGKSIGCQILRRFACRYKDAFRVMWPESEVLDTFMQKERFDYYLYGFDCGEHSWLYPWALINLERLRDLKSVNAFASLRGKIWGNQRGWDGKWNAWFAFREIDKCKDLPSDKRCVVADASFVGKGCSFPKQVSDKIRFRLEAPVHAKEGVGVRDGEEGPVRCLARDEPPPF